MAFIVHRATQNQPNTYAFDLVATSPPVSQESAFIVPANINIFTSVPAGSACRLPAGGYLLEIEILHRDYTSSSPFILTVLPPVGWIIVPSGGVVTQVNAGVAVGKGGSARFVTGNPLGSGNSPIWYVR